MEIDKVLRLASWPVRAITVGIVLLGMGVAALVLPYSTYTVTTSAMAPDLNPDEVVLVAPVDANLDRSSIVTFDSRAWDGPDFGAPFVLRVVAVAGDTISCCAGGGRILVNGRALDEPYLSEENTQFSEVRVPPGRVFLLADARGRGKDSRSYLGDRGGTIAIAAIKGRVVAQVWPAPKARSGVGWYVLGFAGVGLGALCLVAGVAPLLWSLQRRLRSKSQTAAVRDW